MSETNIEIFETDSYTNSLFEDSYVFKSRYNPKTFKFRGQQLSKIELHSRDVPKYEPSNMLLVGSRATGKTSVMREYFKQIQKEHNNVVCVYIDCHVQKTEFKLYSKLYKALKGDNTSVIGFQVSELIETVMNYIVDNDIILIVGLDDYELIRNKNSLNDIMYGLCRAGEKYEGAKVSVIAATSEMKNAKLDNNVRTVFQPVEIYFPKYDENELFYILKQRCEEGFYPNVIDDVVIKYIARMTFDRGDLRDGISLLLKAGRNAEEDNSPKILIKHVY